MVQGSIWRVARAASSMFVLMVGFYYLMVAFDNITNPLNPNASNWPFVQGVLSGDGVPGNSGFEWRFIHQPWIHGLFYLGIILGESCAGVLLLTAGILGIRRAADPLKWSSAQRLSFVGGLVGLLIFFTGFITIGGNWFIMFLNAKWNGLEPAFQNSTMTICMLLFVSLVLVGSDAEERQRR
jgi:predicted small integral membrane protein